jgi:integrase
MKAMILLGINAGMGNTDVAELKLSAIDLKKAVINYPRPKTGIDRRAPLWKETVAAINAAMRVRPEPANVENSGLLFITRWGNSPLWPTRRAAIPWSVSHPCSPMPT